MLSGPLDSSRQRFLLEKSPGQSSRFAAKDDYSKPTFDRLRVLSALYCQPQDDGPLRSSLSNIPLSAPYLAPSIQTMGEARVALYSLMNQLHMFLRTALFHRFGQAPGLRRTSS